jgi:hypothetical protein
VPGRGHRGGSAPAAGRSCANDGSEYRERNRPGSNARQAGSDDRSSDAGANHDEIVRRQGFISFLPLIVARSARGTHSCSPETPLAGNRTNDLRLVAMPTLTLSATFSVSASRLTYLTGFNDRLGESTYHWHDDAKSFTREADIRANFAEIMQGQFDPQDMIDKMVEVIGADRWQIPQCLAARDGRADQAGARGRLDATRRSKCGDCRE